MTFGVNLKSEEGYSCYFEFDINPENGEISARAVISNPSDSEVVTLLNGEVVWEE